MDIPVFDFANPWVALIQLALLYVLPRIVGLVTDRLTKSLVKVLILGGLTVVTSALTWLLDVAIASAWESLDYTAFINVVVNAVITFALAQGVYAGVIKPLGQADRDAASTAIKLVGPDPQREYEESTARAAANKLRFSVREAIGKADSALAAANVAKAAAAVPIAVPTAKAPRARKVTGLPAPVAGEAPVKSVSDRSAAAKKGAATRAANKAAKASA